MNIYVGNLARTVTEEVLKNLFAQFGEVTSVKMIKDKFTGALRGFAFVEMPSSDEAQQAIAQLNGHALDGQQLRVNEARPMEQRPRRFDNNRSGGGSMGGNGGGFRKPRSSYSNGGGGGWGR
jgi:RNA recognition motif-containing protein